MMMDFSPHTTATLPNYYKSGSKTANGLPNSEASATSENDKAGLPTAGTTLPTTDTVGFSKNPNGQTLQKRNVTSANGAKRLASQTTFKATASKQVLTNQPSNKESHHSTGMKKDPMDTFLANVGGLASMGLGL
jgi:hypothetical protein